MTDLCRDKFKKNFSSLHFNLNLFLLFKKERKNTFFFLTLYYTCTLSKLWRKPKFWMQVICHMFLKSNFIEMYIIFLERLPKSAVMCFRRRLAVDRFWGLRWCRDSQNVFHIWMTFWRKMYVYMKWFMLSHCIYYWSMRNKINLFVYLFTLIFRYALFLERCEVIRKIKE